jgi:hypothetical protein
MILTLGDVVISNDRRHVVSFVVMPGHATTVLWGCGGAAVSDVKRLRELEAKNAKLKTDVAAKTS